jgi:hypothetical protein
MYAPPEFMKRLEATKESIYFNPRIAPLLDCFNQMGNVTFLRKRHDITRNTTGGPGIAEIKNVYKDYFMSVREGLGRIRGALVKTAKKFDLPNDLQDEGPGAAHPKKAYSERPKMSIS